MIRNWRWLLPLGLAVAVAIAGCDSDSTGPGEEEQEPDATALFPGLTVSDAGGGGAALAAGSEAVTYISASPGTFPDARMITITNLANGKSQSVTPFNGGFDPLPLEAQPGDEIEIVVHHSDGSTSRYLTKVPPRKRPRVVRTLPPRDATDVVLSASLLVVFSEPLDASTATSETIQLQLAGEPVEATVELTSDGLKAELTPAEPLEAGATYTLVITTSALDLEGDGLEEEVQVTFSTQPPIRFASVSAGHWHTCALSDAGEAYCWGNNDLGQLGHRPPPPDGVDTVIAIPPMRVNTNIRFASLAVGRYHTCGLARAGRAFCWGWNGGGQLGNGTYASTHVPAAVSGAHDFVTLVAGWDHTCGLTPDGTAYCWGWNGGGQLGNGTYASTHVPAAVSGGLNFISLGGSAHMCGLTGDGAVYWWGYLGDSHNYQSSAAPIPLAGGVVFAGLASSSTGGASLTHGCGLTSDGTAYCWGGNPYGQLGYGSPGGVSFEPVAVAGGHRFASLAVGAYHTCGLDTTGAAYCWGANHEAELGVGEAGGQASYPFAVHGGYEFVAIDAGLAHTCAITADGDLYCWGYNAQGQLGIPLSDTPAGWSTVPVEVEVQ